jgi:dTMP kinase
MSDGRTSPSRGLLVTFEGPEGSGKTTLIDGIARRLAEQGCEPLIVREPGGTVIGESIRSLLLDPRSTEMYAETELLLMVASRAQLVRERLLPALEAGLIVLCDRFADASVAYQGFGRGLGERVVNQLNAFALGELLPDVTFLCMISPEDGRRRLEGRRTDRLDREALDFHQRVYEGYQAMATAADPRYVVLDASRSPDDVLAAALDRLKRLEHGLLKYL